MARPYESTHIIQITDTTDDTARLKILSAYTKHAGRLGIVSPQISVSPATNTLSIGVQASELVNSTERPDKLLLGLNCAPPDKKEGTKNNHRKDFYFADLGDGVFAGGTINGYELSYLKGRVKQLFRLASTNKLNSQFRSLQILPEHLLRFSVEAERQKLVESDDLILINDDILRSLPDITHVIEVDSFKNVKIYPSEADAKLLAKHTSASFSFGDQSIELDTSQPKTTEIFQAVVSDKLFDAGVGTNIIARESSSFTDGKRPVPIIATIRDRPAEQEPNYTAPQLGAAVKLDFAA